MFSGNTLRKTRLDLGLTLKKLEDKSGVTVRTLVRLEAGIGNPKINTLATIAKQLGMTVDELFLRNPEDEIAS